MKKTIFAIVAAATVSVSCTSFLNVDKIGKSTIASFFSEIGGVKAAGEGLHKEMMSFYESSDNVVMYSEITGNTLCINTVDADDGSKYLYNFEERAEYVATYPRNLWKAGYAVITAANNIIYHCGVFRQTAQESEIPDVDKVIAWAHFARALAHFQICNAYAMPYCYTKDASHIGVPVVERVPGFDEMIPRNTVAEVYKSVLADLEKALEMLGNDSITDCTRISGIACEALLARVYLYMGDYANAAKYASTVMGKVKLSPREEYVNMFRLPAKNLGTETILRFNSYDHSTHMLAAFDPTRTHDFYPDPTFAAMFDADDVRAQLLTYVAEECENEEYRGKSFSAVCKHLPYKSITDESDRHPYVFVLRCSEMYLIHAEALCCGENPDLNGAADDLKAIIARAKGIDPSAVVLNYTGKDDLEALIEKERMRELCYEGHSHFDVLRRGRDLVRFDTSNSKIKNLKYPDHRFILPIDQYEMQSNDAMVQNEGY